MQYSIVKYQTVLEEEYSRIDPEFYLPSHIELENKLVLINHSVLGDTNIFKLYDGPFGSDLLSSSYTLDGVPALRMQNITNVGLLNITNVEYISNENADNLKKHIAYPGDVVVTKIGFLGFSTVLPKDYDRYFFRRELTRVQIKDKTKVNPYYLATFFNTIYGRQQALRFSSGTTRDRILLVNQRQMIIPLFSTKFQKMVEYVCKKTYLKIGESIHTYDSAQTLLLSELGLLDWKPKHSLSFVKNYSDTQQAGRFDAEYFQSKYDEIVEVLVNKHRAKPIGDYDIFDITTGQYSDEYVESNKGAPYIRGTDLTNGSVDIDNLLHLPIQSQIEAKKAKAGDVVVTRVGTIGLSAIIPKECEGGTISDNLIRIRISDKEKINTYYLLVYLNSIVGKELMLRNGRGSVQQRLNQETLKEIVFPVLPFDTQLSIAEKIIDSFNLRKQSKHLLECAQKAVEMAIENDEETAMQWLKSQIDNTGGNN